MRLEEHAVKCFAYMIMLIELAKGKKLTGYAIMAHVTEFGLHVSAGTVYYQLGVLAREGILKKTRMGKKTVYEMTKKGMTAFKEFGKKWQEPLAYVCKNLS